MKLLEFNEAILDRIMLLRASFVFTWQKETAYWGNNWASVLSTTFYTFALLLFINILFSKVNSIAGYTKNDMMFLFFISQLTFYLNAAISFFNLTDLIEDVNQGNLDLVLTKPIPSLFYVSFKKIRFFSLLRDCIPPTLVIVILINWSILNLSLVNIIIGTIVLICGLICLHAFQLMAIIPVFWLGESKNIMKIARSVREQGIAPIPLESYPDILKFVLGTFLPVLICAQFSASIILGKSNPIFLLTWALVIAVIAIYVMTVVWNIALRQYSSASS